MLTVPWSRFFLTAVALVLLGSCGRGGQPANADKPQDVKVKLASVESGTIDNSSEFVASLQSRRSVSLQPRIEGQVSKIFVSAGDEVAVGTPLLQVDPAEQQASVSSSVAAAESARADIANAKALLGTYQAERQSKLADLNFNQQQFNRYSTLYAQGAISKQNLDQYANSLAAARASLGSTNAQIAAQQAAIAKTQRNLEQSQANTQEQQVQLQYYRINAPIAGTVGEIPVKVGDFVNTSTPLITVTQNQPLEVNISIPIERAPNVQLGTQVKLLNQQNQPVGTSRVIFIAPKVTNETQSVLIKALFDNSAGKLRADQFIRAQVIWDRRPGLLVPTTAVTNLAGKNFVFVAETKEESKLVARQKPVEVGDIQGNNYQVLKGLQPGDKIVVSGIQKLSDGAPITPES